MKRYPYSLRFVYQDVFCSFYFCADPYSDEDPTFENTEDEISVDWDEHVAIWCTVKHRGCLKVKWFKEEEFLLLAHGKDVVVKDSRLSVHHRDTGPVVLHISRTLAKDSGNYICSVRKDANRHYYKRIRLTVRNPPGTPVIHHPYTYVSESETVRLDCRIDYRSNFKILWGRGRVRDVDIISRNERVFKDKNHFSVRKSINLKTWTLEIHNVRYTDSINYNCIICPYRKYDSQCHKYAYSQYFLVVTVFKPSQAALPCDTYSYSQYFLDVTGTKHLLLQSILSGCHRYQTLTPTVNTLWMSQVPNTDSYSQ
ncbi:lachesin [Elysia marginata]|uniref:Lachesin n=1 Tax=Elysia marginata TaxID=1093978 RepID=A0AAV4JAN0_9GAST|nr:lachesin [Elysia marginata]